MNLTRCMRYWDDLSVHPIACETHGASQERQTSRVVYVGLLILSPKTVPDVSVYKPDSLFQEQLSIYRSYPCNS